MDKICASCFEAASTEKKEDSTIVIFPCQHVCHTACVTKLVYQYCPICKRRLELKTGISKDGLDICCESLSDSQASIIDPSAVYKTIQTNRGDQWMLTYRDILLDKIANAEHLFSKIAYRKNLTEKPGIFLFFASATRFAAACIDYKSERTFLRWLHLSEFRKLSAIGEKAQELYARIGNHDTDYGILIVIEDDWKRKEDWSYQQVMKTIDSDNTLDYPGCLFSAARVMSVSSEKKVQHMKKCNKGGYISGMTNYRPANDNIITSLKKSRPCRCNGHTPSAINAEYTWAKKYLTRMKRKEKC